MPAKATNSATAAALEKVLGGVYTLAVKTHGFHWNVEGPTFVQLHDLFSKQYEALFAYADEVAERIRAMDKKAPSSFAQFRELTGIREQPGAPPADGMLAELVEDYGILAADLEEGIKAAEEEGDADSLDICTRLLHEGQKTAWMLKATLKK